MKKIKLCILILILTMTLFGCNSASLKGLLSEKEDQYSLYVIGDELDGSEFEERDINNVYSILNASSLEVAQKNYPSLKIETSPEYIVFDHKELKYRTSHFEELVSFLENN